MSYRDDEDTKEHPPYTPPEGGAPEPADSVTAPGAKPAEPVGPDVQPTEPTRELQPPSPPSQPVPPPPPPPPSGSWQAGGPPQQWQRPGQWQGQPPGSPQQWQQPGQPWQGPPPPYPPQGWTPQAQQWAGPQYSTSGLVATAGMLLVVFGLVIAVAGAFGFTQGNELGRFVRDYADRIAVFGQRIDRDTLRAFLSAMPSILVVTGIVQLLVGAGVLAHKGWTRGLGALLSILGVLVGVFAVSAALALAPGVSVPMLIAIVLLLGYAFVLLALLAGGSHFRARYPGR